MAILLHLFHRKRQTRATQPIHQTASAVVIEGRRHRIDVPYILPKDDYEVSRLDFQHYALRAVLGADYTAPLNSQTMKIIDIGSGTGRWVIEMARQFPQSHVQGIDLEVPVLHTSIPPNCQFQQNDILSGLPFPEMSFDFVHQRLLVGAIPARRWPSVTQELARITRPGGWIELLESGEEYTNPGPAVQQFKQWWDAGCHQAGFDLSLISHLDELLSSAGLQSVQMKKICMPLGKWAGRVGEMMAVDMHAVFRSFKGFYTFRLGIPAPLFDEVVEALPQEWERYHTSYTFYITLGQRPGVLAEPHQKKQSIRQ